MEAGKLVEVPAGGGWAEGIVSTEREGKVLVTLADGEVTVDAAMVRPRRCLARS